jgi:hypothetical protein
MVITEAWNKLWHAAKVIRERCNDGFLAASSKKGPRALGVTADLPCLGLLGRRLQSQNA